MWLYSVDSIQLLLILFSTLNSHIIRENSDRIVGYLGAWRKIGGVRFPGEFSACNLNVTGDCPVPGLFLALRSLPPLDLSISPCVPSLRSSNLISYPLSWFFASS